MMARAQRSKKEANYYEQPSITPAMTPEDQEDQLISLAVDLAVQRLRDGTASNQLVSEIIKLGTVKERLTREKLQRENEMLRAKTEAIEASKNNGEMYMKAIKAMRTYAGLPDMDFEDEDEYEDY